MNKNKKDYLFIFTITPVQSFIAQARKTRDLYAGSQILSELIKQAIKIAKERHKAKIIIPSLKEAEDLDKIFSITNKFVAKFGNVNEGDLKSIGKNIELKTILYWKRNIANEILDKVVEVFENNKLEINFNEFRRKFNDHITKYFNIYWLFYPIENSDYKNAYQQAEKYLGAIKNVRCFEQFETDEDHRKCSICGERDAIVYRDRSKNKNKRLPSFAYPNALELKVNTMIEENEGLCGICFVKRFYKYEKGKEYFPSTAKITMIDIFNNKDIKNLIDKYKKNFPNCWNDQFLIEENINKTYLKKQGCNINQINLEEIKKELKNIKSLIKDKNIKTSKYYALIKFDGDNMGKWLSGEFLHSEKLASFHKDLSLSLRKFSEKIKNCIDKNRIGRTIYAGGDDFLGFIHIKHLFSTLRKIKELFYKNVNEYLRKNYFLANDITFSAGIVIAHYKDRLSDVLNLSLELENEAKEGFLHKNGLGIAVLSRGNLLVKTILPNEEKYLSLLENITLNNLFIPYNLSYEIYRRFYFLNKQALKYEDFLSFKNMIMSEVSRIIDHSENKIDEKYLNIIGEFINSESNYKNLTNNYYEIKLDNISNFFKLTTQLERIL